MRIHNNVRGYSESRQRYSAGVRCLCCSIAVSVYGNILTAHSKRSVPLFGQFRTYTVFKNALSRFARALSRILLRISGRNSHHGRTQKARTYNTRRSRTPERRVKQRGARVCYRGRRVCLLGLTRRRDKAVSDPADRIVDSCRLHPAFKRRGQCRGITKEIVHTGAVQFRLCVIFRRSDRFRCARNNKNMRVHCILRISHGGTADPPI